MPNGLLNQAQAAAGGMPPTPTAPDLAAAAAAAGAPGPQPAQGAPQPGAAPAGLPAGAGAPPVPVGAPPAPAGVPQLGAAPGAGVGPAGGVDISTGGRATGGVDIGQESASPEEQKEYERAMQALAQVLYGNEKTSNAIVDQIDPNDKVGSTAKVSMLFLKQLDEKIDLDESVVAQMTEETVTRIMELAENRHQITYEESDAQKIVGATWEGIQTMFGMDEQGHAELVNSVGADKLPQLKEQYEAALNG